MTKAEAIKLVKESIHESYTFNHGECCDECNELVLKARFKDIQKEDLK